MNNPANIFGAWTIAKLNEITAANSRFDSFEALVSAKGGYFPTIACDTAGREILADSTTSSKQAATTPDAPSAAKRSERTHNEHRKKSELGQSRQGATLRQENSKRRLRFARRAGRSFLGHASERVRRDQNPAHLGARLKDSIIRDGRSRMGRRRKA